MIFFKNIIKNLLTRRMVVFYIACVIMYLKPEISTQITILATAIIGNSMLDSVTNNIKTVKDINNNN